MSKDKKIVSTAGSLLDNDESRTASPGASSDNKKKSGLVASLYNYSKSGTSSGRNSDGSGSEDAAQKKKQQPSSSANSSVLTENDLLDKYHRGVPIKSADVLKLTKPTESSIIL
jgi:hypothetical protein